MILVISNTLFSLVHYNTELCVRPFTQKRTFFTHDSINLFNIFNLFPTILFTPIPTIQYDLSAPLERDYIMYQTCFIKKLNNTGSKLNSWSTVIFTLFSTWPSFVSKSHPKVNLVSLSNMSCVGWWQKASSDFLSTIWPILILSFIACLVKIKFNMLLSTIKIQNYKWG